MHYATFWKALKIVAGSEKLAASEDEILSRQAQVAHADMCDTLFHAVKLSAWRLSSAETGPARTASLLMSLRDSHRTTGEKLAASPEATAELLQKLAVAEYVDDLLTEQLEKLAGIEYEATRNVQLLGREYAVRLMRGLFA